MEQKILNEAVENISLIKGVIEKTSKSFTAFSKIFISWGVLFILNSILTLVILSNKEKLLEITMQYPFLNYIIPTVIIALLAALMYRNVSKKIPLVGLENHLMKVWLLILVLNVLPPKINVSTVTSGIALKNVIIETNHFSILFFSLAIALIATSLFTGFKQPKYVGYIYIGISIIYAYFNLQIFSGTIIQLLSLIALPFTFLYTGFYLKSRQARGK